jgi:predicted metal-dependent phosphoesterase TrpH
VIDLHTHTTASDGHLSPADLVREAWLAGVRVLAVTDHDTIAGVADVGRAAAQFGLTPVTGIEITAIDDGRDVHVLGYFFDVTSGPLLECLARQRAARRDRVRAIGARLARAGLGVDVERLLAEAPRRTARAGSRAGRSRTRPDHARGL